MAAFTFERLIVVRYPLRRTSVCTVRRAKIIIASIILAVSLAQGITLVTTGVIDLTGKTKMPRYYYKMMRIFNLLEAFVTLVVPPVFIVIVNGFIIRGLVQFNRTFKAGGNRHQPSTAAAAAASNQVENIQVKKYLTFFPFEGQNKFLSIQMETLNPPATNRVTVETILNAEAIINETQQEEEANLIREFGSSSGDYAGQHFSTVAIVEVREDRCCQSPSVSSQSRLLPANDVELIANAGQASFDLENCSLASDNPLTATRREEVEDETSTRNVQHPLLETYLDMDAIQTEDILIQQPAAEEVEEEINNEPMLTAHSIIGLDETNQVNQQEEPLLVRQGTKLVLRLLLKWNVSRYILNLCASIGWIQLDNINESQQQRRKPPATEYTITKKLVFVSTIHILLNLPR